jgi:glycosyltransferase involved in cell wall biosynthesis
MAKVLYFSNALRKNQKPSLLQTESQSHKYTIQRPGILYASSDSKKSRHMGLLEFFKRSVVCTILFCRSFFFDFLILDVTTMAILIAPLLFFYRRPKVAVLHFNVLRRRKGPILWLSRLFFRRIDYFIVHSRYDLNFASELYKIPPQKIAFWPFIRGEPAAGLPNEKYTAGIRKKAYIMSYGANARDYRTLFAAAEKTDLQFIVVARKFNIEGLRIPDNVKVLLDIPLDDCDRLVRNCLFTVFTFDGTEPSCGQVSIVTSLMLGRPIICTDCTAVKDYVVDGYNGLLVNIVDAENLRNKILRLYYDGKLYDKLSSGAKEWAVKNVTPEAFLAHMDKIVTALTADLERVKNRYGLIDHNC